MCPITAGLVGNSWGQFAAITAHLPERVLTRPRATFCLSTVNINGPYSWALNGCFRLLQASEFGLSKLGNND